MHDEINLYEALINGQNFMLERDQGVQKFGFYIVRTMKAISEPYAKLKVLEIIRTDGELMDKILNCSTDPPRIIVEEIKLIEHN